MKGRVTKALFDRGCRKYIEISGSEYKVQWRYGRCMCKITDGLLTLHELKVGQEIEFEYETKIWEGDLYLVLKSFGTV
jgi:hypothetical protein